MADIDIDALLDEDDEVIGCILATCHTPCSWSPPPSFLGAFACGPRSVPTSHTNYQTMRCLIRTTVQAPQHVVTNLSALRAQYMNQGSPAPGQTPPPDMAPPQAPAYAPPPSQLFAPPPAVQQPPPRTEHPGVPHVHAQPLYPQQLPRPQQLRPQPMMRPPQIQQVLVFANCVSMRPRQELQREQSRVCASGMLTESNYAATCQSVPQSATESWVTQNSHQVIHMPMFVESGRFGRVRHG